MPQGSMLSLVVFPSTIVLMGIVALLVGWRRHARFVDSIRARRAAEFNAHHLSSTMAFEPEVLITNVMQAEESLLIGYQPFSRAAADAGGPRGTFVAFGTRPDILAILEIWCDQRACIRVELDHLDSRLRLHCDASTELVELSMVPRKNVG